MGVYYRELKQYDLSLAMLNKALEYDEDGPGTGPAWLFITIPGKRCMKLVVMQKPSRPILWAFQNNRILVMRYIAEHSPSRRLVTKYKPSGTSFELPN